MRGDSGRMRAGWAVTHLGGHQGASWDGLLVAVFFLALVPVSIGFMLLACCLSPGRRAWGQQAQDSAGGEEAMSTGTADDHRTVRQAATVLDVSIKAIQKWVKAGWIRGERITPPAGTLYLVLNKEDALAGAPGPWATGPWGDEAEET